MKKIDNCIGINSISKTLRFRAIPVGKTLENIQKKNLLHEDELRGEQFKEVKKYIDRYHKFFIDRVLSNVHIIGLDEYEKLYCIAEKSDSDKKNMADLEKNFREQIVAIFKNDPSFNCLFGKEMIRDILPDFLHDEGETEIVNNFSSFTTVFTKFNDNRKNMYSSEDKNTAIAHRCINDNLPRFLSNRKQFIKIKEYFDENIFDEINNNYDLTYKINDCFELDFFDFVLSQQGIDLYNNYINGYVLESGEKIKGLNEYINLYNQKLLKDEKNKKLPKFKPLFKQILSESDKKSFYIDSYDNDISVFDGIESFFEEIFEKEDYSTCFDNRKFNVLDTIENIFKNFEKYNSDKILVNNNETIKKISKDMYGDWSFLINKWNELYDLQHIKVKVKDYEKYDEKRKKEFNTVLYFSLSDINNFFADAKGNYSSVEAYYYEIIKCCIDNIKDYYNTFYNATVYKKEKNYSLHKNEKLVAQIKQLLDEVKKLELIIKPIAYYSNLVNSDELFYGDILPVYDTLISVDGLYNKVRNYITKKPYSKDKFKLYFENPQFLGGWDKNKESDYRAAILRKNNKYYIAVIDKNDSKVLMKNKYRDELEFYEKLDYKLLPDPSKMLPKVFFSKKGLEKFKPSKHITDIKQNETFKKGDKFVKKDCEDLIDYYKTSIFRHDDWSHSFDFKFKDTKEYCDITSFYDDVSECGYKIGFSKISVDYIEQLVNEGKIYLFVLYNKDFSEYSHGKKNLHTLYFLSAFDENNAFDYSVRLNGGAEMFYRPASINKEDRVIHNANEPIETKNPLNDKKTVTFGYDIIKDKRFTEDQFMFHVPITINANAKKKMKDIDFNCKVRSMLKQDKNPYVIGIDRGERNLLYACVIDGSGNIVKQMSLNEIVNEYNGGYQKVNYHDLLDEKEKNRKEARQNWTTIENIKELKEGYISQVVHKICQWVEEYDAVIAMEDLNSGFKRGRIKVEKQVYQKFEKMLIEKLNYMVDKSKLINENGGVLKGYQLTNKFDSFKNMKTQNGFIFYIPAWLTSKIDPITGFVDLLKPKYNNKIDAQKFISSFNSIRFNKDENLFEFKFDYSDFERADIDYKKKWTVYSYGERVKNFRNPNKNNEWDNEVVDLTYEFKKIFDRYNISYGSDNMIEKICEVEDVSFYKEFIGTIKLMLQMRNSITGRTDVDYIISPVKDCNGNFYDSRNYNDESARLPMDADANGAYNIARKVLWAIEVFKNTDDDSLSKAKIAISNKEWLEYAQTHNI